MPKEKDESLKISSKTGKELSTYDSKIRASEKYDKENVDNIRVRVPKGWKEQMQSYVKTSKKYDSINGMICDLIKQEIPNIKSSKEIENNE